MKPEQLEIVRLKREVAKLKAERDFTGSGTDGTLGSPQFPSSGLSAYSAVGLAPRLLRRDRRARSVSVWSPPSIAGTPLRPNHQGESGSC